jgi:hypothetical protein
MGVLFASLWQIAEVELNSKCLRNVRVFESKPRFAAWQMCKNGTLPRLLSEVNSLKNKERTGCFAEMRDAAFWNGMCYKSPSSKPEG